MPRKDVVDKNPTPVNEEHKLSDESRKAIFGRSEEESAPEDGGHNRQTNAPSPSGAPDSHGADRGS